MDKVIKLLKSKTFWVAIVGALLTIAEVNSGMFASLMPPAYQPYLLAFWPLVMIVMRTVTTTALSEK